MSVFNRSCCVRLFNRLLFFKQASHPLLQWDRVTRRGRRVGRRRKGEPHCLTSSPPSLLPQPPPSSTSLIPGALSYPSQGCLPEFPWGSRSWAEVLNTLSHSPAGQRSRDLSRALWRQPPSPTDALAQPRLHNSPAQLDFLLPPGFLSPPQKWVAPHSSTLAWKIPWMEEPGRLQSMGSLRVGHDWATSLSLFTFHFHAVEKEMATHSSVLAWRIPGTGEPGGLPSMGSHRVGHDWSDLAAQICFNRLS